MIVYVIYDRSRQASSGWEYWRVATFLERSNAEVFLRDCKTTYSISCENATVAELALARDGVES